MSRRIIGLSTTAGQITVGIVMKDLGMANNIERQDDGRYIIYMNMAYNEVIVDSLMGGNAFFQLEIPSSEVKSVLVVNEANEDKVLTLHHSIIRKLEEKAAALQAQREVAMEKMRQRGGPLPHMLHTLDGEDEN